MLYTFVIGLREGLEAALIVGIVAAFLRQQGRTDLLRWVWVGVGTAAALCAGVGILLHEVADDLPQAKQEGLETVIGVLAVAMVTYMVVWMRRHSRQLKGQLEGMAADAMHTSARAGRAMVLMAFLAVFREGFETVVFLLAAFNSSSDVTTAMIGAVLGLVVAVGLGYGIYRGGVRINLSKFFRATGLVLVLVAAGLVVSALHTAHEAGWLNAGQARTVDLSSLITPNSVQESLLTGMLGFQAHPVVIEVFWWLAYLIPVGLYVAWPPTRPLSRARQRIVFATVAAAGLIAGIVALLAAPGTAAHPTSTVGGHAVTVQSAGADTLTLRTPVLSPAAGGSATAPRTLTLRAAGFATVAGRDVDVFRVAVPGAGAAGRPSSTSLTQLATQQGGRLPIGLNASAPSGHTRLDYTDSDVLTAYVDSATGRVLDLRWREQVDAVAVTASGSFPLDTPVASRTSTGSRSEIASAAAAARGDEADTEHRSTLHTIAAGSVVIAALALLALGIASRPRRVVVGPAVTRNPEAALAGR